MRFGIACTLKDDLPPPPGTPDDWQEEFDSQATVQAIAAVIRELGHSVDILGDGPALLRRLLQDPPDVVFNFAEGRGVYRSREAWVPAVCEMLGLPYTGSDPLTCAATLDKDYAKRLMTADEVDLPRSIIVLPDEPLSHDRLMGRLQHGFPGPPPLEPPFLVKPAWEGSSKGIRRHCLVTSFAALPAVVAQIRGDYRQPVLVEEFIAGDELTVGLIGNGPSLEVVGVMRVVPRQPTAEFIYSLEVKRDFRRQVRYEVPPPYPPAVMERIESAAKTVYHVLDCRDFARIDFRLRDEVPYFIECNPLPGLNPESSDLVILSRLVGWSYSRLVSKIVDAALVRLGLA